MGWEEDLIRKKSQPPWCASSLCVVRIDFRSETVRIVSFFQRRKMENECQTSFFLPCFSLVGDKHVHTLTHDVVDGGVSVVVNIVRAIPTGDH